MGNPNSLTLPSAIVPVTPYPVLRFSPASAYGIKADGTDETVKVQKWIDDLTTYGLIGILPPTKIGIGIITLHGGQRIEGVFGSQSGFTLIGNGAGFTRDADISDLYWSNFSIVGDNNEASAQIAFVGPSSHTMTNYVFNNISVSQVLQCIDLSNSAYGNVWGGKIGPTTSDGSSPGHGYGIVIGGTPASINDSISVDGVHFYGCTRHAFYAGVGTNITSSNLIFENHRQGLTPNSLAALVYSRGTNFTNSNSLWKNSESAAWLYDSDDAFGVDDTAATTFTLINPTVLNVTGISLVGWGAPSTDATSNHTVSITGINWESTAGGYCIWINGCDTGIISGQFRLAQNALNSNIQVLYVNGVQTQGPYCLKIDIQARTSTNNTYNTLVELNALVCASTSDAEIFIAPTCNITSISGSTAPQLFYEDAEIQNAKIICPSNARSKAITGATPWVSGYQSFALTQSGAVNVTNFQGGYEGQVIVVVVGDTNTTFKQGATIKTRTGADVAAGTAGVAYTFKNIGGVWYQQ